MKILFATDGSRDAQAAVEVLTRLPLPPDTEMLVLTVIDQVAPVSFLQPQGETLDQQQGPVPPQVEDMLAREVERFRETGWHVSTMVRQGHVVQQIIEAADECAADLVVVGSRGLSGVKRFLLGSVSQGVVQYAPCSVLVTRWPSDNEDAGEQPVRGHAENVSRCRILVAYDGSAPARAAVDTLVTLPLQARAEVTVVTVLTLITSYRMDILQQLSAAWQEEKQAAQAELETIARMIRQATPEVTTQWREGADPSHEILEVAAAMHADLILVGHKGKGSVERFLLGSVSERIVQYAPCSVWLTRMSI
jgi:nucleotide-binding universal stress UspA family protein